MRRIAVAVSGGADSLHALVSLRDQGHAVVAMYGRFLLPTGAVDPLPGLHNICQRLGVPLHVRDLSAPFEHAVVRPFVATYARGHTPNPCALCNARVKFGLLLDAAREQGAEYLATGHYAALRDHPRYGRVLAEAADSSRDQSYFLSLVPAARLNQALFPMAQIHKKDAVAHLAARGIAVPLPKESREICFVPQDRYGPFLEEYSRRQGIRLGGPGPILLIRDDGQERPVGVHQGLWRHTEGQRRGLGIAWKAPLYVMGKDTRRNALLLGTQAQVRMESCRLQGVNLLTPPHLWPEEVRVRVRYRQGPMAARVCLEMAEEGSGPRIDIRFLDAPLLTAPGQIATLYDAEGHVLVGGVIAAVGLRRVG